MVNKVVSTKLTEEEHTALLDACSIEGQTPSSFIRATIVERLIPKEVRVEQPSGKKEDGSRELRPIPPTNKGISELEKLIRLHRSQNASVKS